MTWELVPDFTPLLEQVLAAPARVVKESPAKLVTEHEVDGRRFYVKRYRHLAVPFRSWKFHFKPTQARGEWRLAALLEERKVPTVRHLGLGERRSWRGVEESVLITEGFPGLPANDVPNLPPAAVVAFIEFIGRAGVVQRDLHPANLLAHPQTHEIRLVDLHGIELRDTPREADRDLMLAVASMGLDLPVSAAVRQSSLILRKAALRERSRRCLKTNRDFARQRFGDWLWQVRKDALTPEVKKVLGDPDGFLTWARALKRGRSSTVAAGQGVVLKRYNFKKPLNLLKDLWRGSRGRRGFRKGYHLELCGLPTARVLATAEVRVLGLSTRSYVLMEEIPNAIDAGAWRGDARQAGRALGGLLARMHEEGLTHRDLKETNLLFNQNGEPHLIDLDGLGFVSEITLAEARTNLERLAAGLDSARQLSRPGVLAFLFAYCRRRRLRPRQLFPRR